MILDGQLTDKNAIARLHKRWEPLRGVVQLGIDLDGIDLTQYTRLDPKGLDLSITEPLKVGLHPDSQTIVRYLFLVHSEIFDEAKVQTLERWSGDQGFFTPDNEKFIDACGQAIETCGRIIEDPSCGVSGLHELARLVSDQADYTRQEMRRETVLRNDELGYLGKFFLGTIMFLSESADDIDNAHPNI
ncbi:MAG: hypothetical protein AAF413_03875 [Patescibacteria group bacterium]